MSLQSKPSRPERGGSLLKALSNTGIFVSYFDLDFRATWAENVPEVWSDTAIDGRLLNDFLPESVASELVRAK